MKFWGGVCHLDLEMGPIWGGFRKCKRIHIICSMGREHLPSHFPLQNFAIFHRPHVGINNPYNGAYGYMVKFPGFPPEKNTGKFVATTISLAARSILGKLGRYPYLQSKWGPPWLDFRAFF